MANFSAFKKNKRLPSPPDESSIKENLQQPELAPYEDGRNRKTGRTHQLSTRVKPEFYYRVKEIAARDRIKIVELLEEAVELYEIAKQK